RVDGEAGRHRAARRSPGFGGHFFAFDRREGGGEFARFERAERASGPVAPVDAAVGARTDLAGTDAGGGDAGFFVVGVADRRRARGRQEAVDPASVVADVDGPVRLVDGDAAGLAEAGDRAQLFAGVREDFDRAAVGGDVERVLHRAVRAVEGD